MYPYFDIWFKTSHTVDKVLSNKIKFNYILPIILVSFSNALEALKLDFGLPGKMMAVLVVTGMGTFFLVCVIPWSILKVGHLWKGQADMRALRKIIGLMQIPALLILLAQMVRLSFGEIATRDEISYPIHFVVWLFGLRIFIIGIARAQRFHYGLALLNIVLVLIPLLVVVLMFRT